jgi:hypothetical protein
MESGYRWAMARRTTRGNTPPAPLPDSALELFRRWGREGGLKRKARLSPERRKAIAKKAVAARDQKRVGAKRQRKARP